MLRLTIFCLLFVSTLALSLPSKDVELSYGKGENAISEIGERVYGGQDADAGEYPSQVSILYAGLHNCGGTIISENYILTAAHCIKLPGSGLMKIRVGTNDWNTGTDHEIVSLYPHPNFNFTDFSSEDIGLIEVSPPIVFNDLVKPATLPPQDQGTTAGSDAIIVGWGLTENSTLPPIHLQEGFILIRDQQECVDIYAFETAITEKQICADVPEGGIGVCSGDSGGPLYVDGEIVGIVSWSASECASQGFPGVFTRVSAFRDWITEHSGV